MPTDEPDVPLDVSKLRAVQAPHFYASSFRIHVTGVDIQLVLQRSTPMESIEGIPNQEFARLDAVAIVTLSPGGMKDLALLLSDQVTRYEDALGPIVTPFTRSREAPERQK